MKRLRTRRLRTARATTLVERVHLQVDADRLALVARVSAPNLDPTELRLRVHDAGLAERVDTSATPFLPMATLLAARLGTTLVIDAPVDALALERATRAGELIADWWGWRSPRIAAATTMPAAPCSSGTGLWYTRGIDSTDTLLRSRAGELVDDGRPVEVTHLLGLDWIDPPFAVSSMPGVWSETKEAAASLGLPLVGFTTDVRRVLDPVMSWEQSHGAVFGGLGLLLGPLLRSVLLSGSAAVAVMPAFGSHPLLDHFWSTAATQTRHVDAERRRSEKVARVAQDQWALDRLKVCWRGDTPRNCGRCSKCLLTMTLLEAVGALDRCTRFDAPLSADAVWALARIPEPLTTLPETVVDILSVLPLDAVELRAAWAAVGDRLARDATA